MAKPTRTKRKEKKNVVQGLVFIQSTFNNTIVSSADIQGNVIAWSSSGAAGFKGVRKSTPFAAQQAADVVAKKSMDNGMRTVKVMVSGPGSGRETAIREWQEHNFLNDSLRRGSEGHDEKVEFARAETTIDL